jgi:hypothetical protein
VSLFPDDSAARKTYPMFSGLLQYFPSALAEVARHSYRGNEKHNPGQPLHHDRAKSDDEADALVRHLVEGDYVGTAWRALSLLQKDLETKGAPIAPGARNAARTEPAVSAMELAAKDGITADGSGGLVRESMARVMERDGVIPADDDEGRLPAEGPRIPVENQGRDA